MNTTERLCLVIPSLNPGGMERVMSELAGQFALKKEIDLHLILYGLKPTIFYQLPENITIHKPDFEFNNSKRFHFTLKTLHFLRKKIMQIKPNSILSFGEFWNSFVLLAMLGLKYPVYISDRCQPDKDFGIVHSFLRKWLYPKARGIIAQTNVAKGIFENQFKHRNIHTIGNPLKRIIPLSNLNKENIILSVGRLIKTKHYDNLITIFSKLNAQDWKLVIVGGNALKQVEMSRLQNLVKELNLSNRVVLTGEQQNVDSYYLKSRIFAFTSSSEGFPNVIGEALSAGLPVVSYDCITGPSEMISNGENGYLVPLFDNITFQEKLQQLIDNDDLRNRMSEIAKQSLDRFSVELIGAKYLEVILENS